MPVGVLNDLVEGDICHWGPRTAGALFGPLPVVCVHSFFRVRGLGHDGLGERIGDTHPGPSPLKTYDIEVQRLKALRHNTGAIELQMDALVMAQAQRDEGASVTSLRLSVNDARTLLVLLKQQFSELDKLHPRSRRSGRA